MMSHEYKVYECMLPKYYYGICNVLFFSIFLRMQSNACSKPQIKND